MKNFAESIKKSINWIKLNRKHLAPSKPIAFFLMVGLAGLLAMSLIRFAFYISNADMLEGVELSLILKAFWTGVRYDIVVTFYTLIFPIALVGIAQFTRGITYRILTRIAVIFCAIMYGCFMLGIGDIPFYEHFETHINALIINYASSGPIEAIEMIFKDSTYRIFAISAILSAILFVYFIHKMSKRYIYEGASPRRRYTMVAILIFFALTPIWSRGLYFQRRPMESRDAYISDNKIVNEIAKNPEFNVFVTLGALSQTFNLIDPQDAIGFAKQELGKDDSFATYHEAKSTPFKHIVFIIQESSTVHRFAYKGAEKKLVPTLDRLRNESLYFDNTYSSNSRTCCGIYSIVASFPAYGGINPTVNSYCKLPTLFSQYCNRDGFETIFFVTHDRHYDNVHEFVSDQGFKNVFGQEDYGIPESKLKTWGVDDHVMFDFAVDKLDKEISSGDRVIAVLLTCSNHNPFNAPLNVGFTPAIDGSDEEIAIQYADWSLNRFIESVKEKEWFDDTLFVITGDHGRAITNDFAISDSQVHIPLMFYAPKHIKPEIRNDLVAQMDITPTTFAMAGLEFENRTLGIDINSTTRRMIPYGNYECVASRNHKWNYVYNLNDQMGFLYDLEAPGNKRYRNCIKEHPEAAEEMHHYAACMTQAGWAIHNNTVK